MKTGPRSGQKTETMTRFRQLLMKKIMTGKEDDDWYKSGYRTISRKLGTNRKRRKIHFNWQKKKTGVC